MSSYPVSAIPEEVAGVDARYLDARGLTCPMPVIELAKVVDEIAVGEQVRLAATDLSARVDVPVWCRMRRQKLHATAESDGVWWFLIERAH